MQLARRCRFNHVSTFSHPHGLYKSQQPLNLFRTAKMSSDEVKVVSVWYSPYVVRVKVALKLKGVEYESLEENLPHSKSDLLLRSNPVHKKVPVLIHGGRPIAESLVILQYIDEVWPSGPAILPSDPYERATARFWAAFLDNQWFPNIHAMLRSGEDEAEKAAIVEKLLHGLILLDEALKKCGGGGGGGGFFGGDRIGYVDLAMGTYLPWISVVERMFNVDFFNEAKTPRLFKWARQFSDNEYVKDLTPDDDRIFEFAVGFRARLIAAAEKK